MSKHIQDSLGSRMKKYEEVSSTLLTRRMPFVIRVDGRAFHTYTKGFKKPWDERLSRCMDRAAHALMENIQGAKLAYVQSDEISLLVTDYDSLQTEPWFGKKVQKIASVSASIATAAFNKEMFGIIWDEAIPTSKYATFDARTFVLPKEEVCNMFIWRQQDAVRNSIQGLGHVHFSHKELQLKNTNEIQNMLMTKRNINWNNCETWQKRGWCLYREDLEIGQHTHKEIVSDWTIPNFTQNRDFIEKHVFLEEETISLEENDIEYMRA